MSMYSAFSKFLNTRNPGPGLTTKAFSGRLGFSAPYLVDIEKGWRVAPDLLMGEMADAFGLDTDEHPRFIDPTALTSEGRAPYKNRFVCS